ncbi:unnamed protein product [Dictyota dichotoma]|uniref:Ribosomal protein S2 n=1 Tax=Dictyota dichotoma TaxID=2876 RepID=Q2TUD1_DICDH|nr:ribosomal protein S2 [Dictyota dichotoma]AAS79065.1 ribosomal protein S2 [Dictyota dichotoma]
MRLKVNKLKYNNFYSVFVNNLGYVGPNSRCIDKSLYPFLIGHRNKVCYLDIWANLGGLKDSFKVLCNVVSNRGKILLVGGDISFVSLLLCLSSLEGFNIVVSPWDFSQIRNKLYLDLIVIHEVDKASIAESEGKFVPHIVVNGLNIKSVPYPCNVSLSNSTISNWYLYALINSCRKGFYTRNKNFNEI